MTELLSSIAILALLIGLLLPALSAARRSSQRVACAANLAQCGRAFASYAASNNGLVPRGYSLLDADKPPWTALIAKELGLKTPFTWADVARLSTLHCPSHPTDGPASHFVVNAFHGADFSTPAGLTKITALRKPAAIPWLLETPPLFNRMSYLPIDDIFLEEARFVSHPDHLVNGKRCRLGTNNHGSGTSNVLYADGHVAVVDNARLRVSDFLSEAR